MQLAVVIPALDEAPRVAEAVRSVRASGLAAAPGDAGDEGASPGAGEGAGRGIECIVVDGGSRDETAERARAAGARVLLAPAGRAGQLAAGLAATAAEVVVFLHADTRLPSGWAGAVRAALADPAVVGGAFAFRFAREPGAPWRADLALVELGARLRSAALRLPYGDQAIFARRAALEAAGGVPAAPIMEDLDLVAALRRRGRFVLLREAVSTSPRRYLAGGVVRTMLRHWAAAAAWALGLDRQRVADWYRSGERRRRAAGPRAAAGARR